MKKTWFIILLALTIISSTLQAQWVKVASGIIGQYNLIYGGAMTSKSGIVWAGIHDLWKSVDSGTTWTKTNFISSSFICQISFFDQNNGIVATYDLGIYLTRDGGNSWQHILTVSECLGGTFNSTKDEILAIDRNSLVGTSHYTSDGGVTWQTQQVESTAGTYHILARGDKHAYILSRSASPAYESHVLESTDFGVTWQKHLKGVDYDSYSFALDSCNPKQIYIGNEEFNQTDNGFSEIYSSTDDGDSWTVVNKQTTKFFTSAVETSANAVFVASSLGTGIYRSTDAGKNWISIGGPVSHEDSRMITVLNDNLIFAADNNGNIWRTTTSGGFPLNISSTPSFQIPAISVPSCFSLGSNVIASFSSCRHLILQGASLQGNDINHFSLVSKIFPYDLGSRGVDTFYVTFDPKHQTGIFSIILHITGYYPTTGLPFDTIITIQAVSNPVGPNLTVDKSVLNYKTITTCDPQKDSVFILTNRGCDTLTIISGPGNIDPIFIIDSLALPLMIPPGGSVIIHVHCKSQGQGPITTFATYQALQQGLTQVIQVQLKVTALQGTNKLLLGSNKINFRPISICSTDSLTGFFANSGCDTLIIDTAGLSGDLDFLADLGSYPIVLPPGDTIRYIVHLDPISKGTRTAIIKIHGHDAQGNLTVIDTTITISGVVKNGSAVLYTPSTSVSFDSLSSCSQADTILHLSNLGCDTLFILPEQISGDPDFTFGSKSQIIILPGDSASIDIKLNPQKSGQRKGQLHLLIGSIPNQYDTVINLSGIIGDDHQKFSLSISGSNFDSTSICQTKDTTLILKDLGCDSLIITSAYLDGDPDFTLTTLNPSLGSGESGTYKIILSPQQLGLRTAHLHLTIGSGANKRDTTLDFTGLIVKGISILSSSLITCDFGTTTICDERDTVITLRNTGCDTLIISGMNGLISGFTTSTTFPIIILPGKDTIIDIHTQIDTANRKNSNSTNLTFTSNSNPALPSIPLSRSITYPQVFTLELIPQQKEKTASDVAQFKLKINPIPQSGIKTLDFTLKYNSDLLAYQSSIGSNTVTTSNDTIFHISGNPFISVDADGVVAEMLYTVYLTNDSTTNLTLSNLHLNSNDPKFEECIALALADSSTFQYQFFCGERSIASFLGNNNAILITSIHPNPAQDFLEVSLQSAFPQNAHFEIVNLLGESSIAWDKLLHAGQNTISFSIPSLAEGLYFIRVSSPTGTATQSFIRMK